MGAVVSLSSLNGLGLAGFGRAFQKSAVAVNLTGTLTETVMALVPLPAGTLGVNGLVRVTSGWTMTNNANNKTMRNRFGASGSGIAGTAFMGVVAASVLNYVDMRELMNRGLANSQIGKGSFTLFGTNTNAFVTSAVDTTAAAELNITGQLANVGDTLTLEYYVAEVFN